MQYAVLKVINGNYSIHAENLTEDAARVSYFGLCQSLWNAPDVMDACAMIVDTNLNIVDGYKEFISKT